MESIFQLSGARYSKMAARRKHSINPENANKQAPQNQDCNNEVRREAGCDLILAYECLTSYCDFRSQCHLAIDKLQELNTSQGIRSIAANDRIRHNNRAIFMSDCVIGFST